MHRRVVIIGNPTTNISSGKFLIKFVNVLVKVAENVTIINDGRVHFKDGKIRVIKSTRINARIEQKHKSLINSLINYGMAQIRSSLALLKCLVDIDIVVIFPISFFAPSIIAKLARKKIVLYEAQDIFSQYDVNELSSHIKFAFLMIIRKNVLRISDYIIVEAKNIIESLQLQQYRSKIYICPQYVDTVFYNIKNSFSQRKCLVGFIASIEARKGAIQFAKAIELVLSERNDVQFIIIGRGPLLNEVEKILEKYLNQGEVIMTDYIPEKDLPNLLNELILYVLPSYSEGLPNSILEAMACGTPVISTKVGGIPDVIRDSETGFLLKDNSPKSIANGILKALNNQNMQTIIAKGRNLIESTYSFTATIRRYKNLFKQIIN